MEEISEEKFEEVLIFQEGVDKTDKQYWVKEGVKWVVYLLIAYICQEILGLIVSDASKKFLFYLLENNKIDFMEIANNFNPYNILVRLTLTLIEGGLIGLANYLVLKTHFRSAHKWIGATIVGYLLFNFGFLFIGNKLINTLGADVFFSVNWISVLSGLILSFFLFFSQYWVLQSWVSKAWLWVISGLLISFLMPLLNISQLIINKSIVVLIGTFIMMFLLRNEFLNYYSRIDGVKPATA